MILVTGATGIVGRAVIERLSLEFGESNIKAAVRNKSSKLPKNVQQIFIKDLINVIDWTSDLRGVNLIIHCAARTHVMKDLEKNPLVTYRKINVDATLNLAKQAASAGVKRFIFISSIKVNGSFTVPGSFFTEDDSPNPSDPYSISKKEAEDGLRVISQQTGMEFVIVRPPLVYGPEVKGNFSLMVKWVSLGLPLPLGGINNKRSLVSLSNLVDFLMVCLTHPKAKNQIFLVSDGEDVSTTDLIKKIAIIMNVSQRLVSLPKNWLELIASLLGKQAELDRLTSSLQVDTKKARLTLNWNPPQKLEEGLKKAIQRVTIY